jgi:acetyl-CoA C-acetyltransferase
MAAGIPKEVPAWGVNQVCGSGLRSVALASQAIRTGDASIVVAGGQENMSLSPHAAAMRSGTKMGGVSLVDTMIVDGLTDVFNGYHMGMTAENLAEQYQIGRDAQDAFAAASQNKAERARASAASMRRSPPLRSRRARARRGSIATSSSAKASRSPRSPASSPRSSATAAPSPPPTRRAQRRRGRARLMSREEAERRGSPILARVASWASAGVDPSIMGIGPVPASRMALDKAGWTIRDLDLIEANEAFAAQALAVGQELAWDAEIVNVNGGAIAIGHPIGASGARILTTLVHEMGKRDARKGLATLCIGGGMGIALCIERP